MPNLTSDSLQLYTRWEHGSHRVIYDNNSWKLHHPSGLQIYTDGDSLLHAIMGCPPRTSVEKYFKLGKYATAPTALTPQSCSTLSLFSNVEYSVAHIANRKTKPMPIRGKGSIRIKSPGVRLTSASTLDLLAEIEAEKQLVAPAPIITPGNMPTKKKKAKAKPRKKEWSGLGVDLENRSDEVRKLLYAGFGKRIHQFGYDPEDVLQEVYRGLLARNMGKCPWDESKSSFGHYVHMVCGCILSNYHRRYSRINSREKVGMMGWNEDGEFGEMDAALSIACQAPASQMNDMYNQALIEEIKEVIWTDFYDEKEIALKVLPLLIEGYTRRQISKMLNIREGRATFIVKRIQAVALQLWGKRRDQEVNMVSDIFGG